MQMKIETMSDIASELSILDRLLDAVHDNGALDDEEQMRRRDALEIVFQERFRDLFGAVKAAI